MGPTRWVMTQPGRALAFGKRLIFHTEGSHLATWLARKVQARNAQMRPLGIGLRMEQLEKSAPKFKAGSLGGRLKQHTRAGNRGLFYLAADSQRELAFRLCAEEAFYLEAKF